MLTDDYTSPVARDIKAIPSYDWAHQKYTLITLSVLHFDNGYWRRVTLLVKVLMYMIMRKLIVNVFWALSELTYQSCSAKCGCRNSNITFLLVLLVLLEMIISHRDCCLIHLLIWSPRYASTCCPIHCLDATWPCILLQSSRKSPLITVK